MYVISPNEIVPIAAAADPLKAATEALIAWSVVVKEALKLDIGKVDEPLILVTTMSLAVEAELLNAEIGAVDEPLILVTIVFLAVDADPLSVAIGAVDEPLIFVTIVFLAVEADALKPVSILSAINCLAVEADPLSVATEELIVLSVVCKLLLKVAYPVVDVMSTCTEPETVPDGKLPVIASANGTSNVFPLPRNI